MEGCDCYEKFPISRRALLKEIRQLLDLVTATTLEGRYEDAFLLWSTNNDCTTNGCTFKSDDGQCSHTCALSRMLQLSVTYDRERTFETYKLLKGYMETTEYQSIQRDKVHDKTCRTCKTIVASVVAGNSLLVTHRCMVDVADDERFLPDAGEKLDNLEGTCDRWSDRIEALSQRRKNQNGWVRAETISDQPTLPKTDSMIQAATKKS